MSDLMSPFFVAEGVATFDLMSPFFKSLPREWQLSGLEDVVFHDFIKDDFISEGDCQVPSGFASLPDPVALETEEQTLEREQNERDVLEALGEYKCDARMSVENVPAVVNIKTLKGRFIAHKFSTLGGGSVRFSALPLPFMQAHL